MRRQDIVRFASSVVSALFVAGLVMLPACSDRQGGQPAKKPPVPTIGPEAKPALTTPATQEAGAEPNAPEAAPAVAKAGMEPIPLVLPKPRFAGTPKNVPPGTRVPPPTKGPIKARPPFFAPKGTTNVALKKPVISSDMEPVIGSLDLITDGSKEAVEDAYVELGPEVQWVQIDLKDNFKIHALVVWHEHKDPRVYHDVVVQVADDKDFITNVRMLYNNDHDNSAGQGIGPEKYEYFETNEGMLIDAKGVVARYVRLYSNGSTADDLNRYTEVEVYGQPAK